MLLIAALIFVITAKPQIPPDFVIKASLNERFTTKQLTINNMAHMDEPFNPPATVDSNPLLSLFNMIEKSCPKLDSCATLITDKFTRIKLGIFITGMFPGMAYSHRVKVGRILINTVKSIFQGYSKVYCKSNYYRSASLYKIRREECQLETPTFLAAEIYKQMSFEKLAEIKVNVYLKGEVRIVKNCALTKKILNAADSRIKNDQKVLNAKFVSISCYPV